MQHASPNVLHFIEQLLTLDPSQPGYVREGLANIILPAAAAPQAFVLVETGSGVISSPRWEVLSAHLGDDWDDDLLAVLARYGGSAPRPPSSDAAESAAYAAWTPGPLARALATMGPVLEEHNAPNGLDAHLLLWPLIVASRLVGVLGIAAAQRAPLTLFREHHEVLVSVFATCVDAARTHQATSGRHLLAAALDAHPDMLFQFDANGRFIDYRASGSMRPVLPPDAFLGRRIDEVLPGPVALSAQGAITKALAQRTVERFEYRLDTESGARIFEARVVAYNATSAAAIVRDVTEATETARALERSEAQLAVAQGVARMGSWQYDFGDGRGSVSAGVFRLLGVDIGLGADEVSVQTEFTGEASHVVATLALRAVDDDVTLIEEAYSRILEGEPASIDFRVRVADEVRWIHAQADVIIDATGAPSRVHGTFQDVTERKLTERRQQWETDANAALADLFRALVATDPMRSRVVEHIVAYGADLTGSDGAIAGHPEALLRGEVASAVDMASHGNTGANAVPSDELAAVWAAGLEQRSPQIRLEPSSQTLRNYVSAPAVLDGEIVGQVLFFNARTFTARDLALASRLASAYAVAIHQRRITGYNQRLLAQVTQLATVDSLTGTLNRRRFLELASAEFARAQRHGRELSIVLFDVDLFKQINDTCGHLTGDAVLVELAGRCKHSVRSIDLIGRFGGEEFVAMLPESDLGGAAIVAERMRRAVADSPVMARGEELEVTVSVGVAAYDADCEHLEELLRRADAAMYAAKRAGRNAIAVWGKGP